MAKIETLSDMLKGVVKKQKTSRDTIKMIIKKQENMREEPQIKPSLQKLGEE